ncbi:acyltransferase family protein [Neoroseomonas soli]|uniref:Acyltransferase n=1 Tax=Neoroseomonas soli TaxID=1081025 RepID=A0A9X9WWG2_9PROT|nr:acyltransferase family protein [Neoroseomonas soli]MBR0671491.1 acyltransferase [Neoroseomonas soli]
MPRPEDRNASFDLLRLVACFLVVAWHTKLLGPSSVMLAPAAVPPPITWADLLYFNGFLLAVPFFLTLANWLLYERLARPDGSAYLRRRLSWLGALYLFWSVLYSLYEQIPFACGAEPLGTCLLRRLLTGNGTAANYYLASQILADLTLAALLAVGPGLRKLLGVALVLVFLVVELLALQGRDGGLGLFWSPLSFAAIPPLVVLARRYQTLLGTPAGVAALAFAAVATMALEWRLFATGGGSWVSFPPYCRLSEVLAALALVLAAERWRLPRSALLRHFAEQTLGIYLVHFFVIFAVTFWIGPASATLVTALVFGLSYLVVLAARPVLKQRLL